MRSIDISGLRIPLLASSLLVLGVLAEFPSSAVADSVTFQLRDLVFSGPAGQNGLPNPLNIVEPGVDGHLLWTYPPGDFAAGTGVLQDLALPITAMPLGEAVLTVDADGLTGTNPGNYHDLTYDWQIVYAVPLSGPMSTSTFNPGSSSFDFTGTYWVAPGVGFNGEWLGNITGGVIEPVPPLGDVRPTGAGQGDLETRLDECSPSPFRQTTSVRYELARPGNVRLEVYGADGQRVATLAEDTEGQGSHRASWDGRDGRGQPARAGVYYVRLQAAGSVASRPVVLLP